MTFNELAEARRSVSKYDTTYEVTDEQLKELFATALLSPSSFNLQHWHFVVVRSPEGRKAMREASFNQPHVEECSAVIVVCGNLKAYENAARIYESAADNVRERVVPLAVGMYSKNAALARDEAIRSGSLIAMTIMYKAVDMGLATCPMIGFDPAKVSKLAGMPDHFFPVMLLTLGKQHPDYGRPRAFRMPMEEAVTMETVDGPGLGADV